MHVQPSLILATVCLIGTVFVGCNRDERARSETTSDVGVSLNQVRSEIAGARVQVDATTDSLENLLGAEESDTLPKRYQLFVQSLQSLEQQREQLSVRADDMLERQEEYLTSWRGDLEGIEHSQLRQVSRQRMDTLSAKFGDVREQLIEAEYAMQPMIRTLRGIQTSLSYDLSMENVQNVSQALDQSSLQHEQIDQALTKAQNQLSELDQIAALQ